MQKRSRKHILLICSVTANDLKGDGILSALSYLHNATTLLFGVYVSAAFLGIRMKRKNVLILMCFSLAVGAVYLGSFLLFGESVTERIYPLIVHMPLVLFLTLFYKSRFALSALAVVTAYLCCQISKWGGLAAFAVSGSPSVYYCVRIAITVITFAILMLSISKAAARFMQKPTKDVVVLGLMPFVYYIFDYVSSVYTDLLYSGLEIVEEFLGFVLCMAYLVFLFLYFRQYEEKCEAERQRQLLEMQRTQSEREVEAIRRSEREVAILRHDMRHFLSGISSYIESGETDRAIEYISDIIKTTDKTATGRYTANKTVNMILASHEAEMQQYGIDFRCTVGLPETLPVSDVDITSILSNGLENAVKAVQLAEADSRIIILDMHISDGKLLLSLKNTYGKKPVFRDGMPVSSRNGHGFGTQSIQYVTEKLGGNCLFTLDGDMFVLQAVV